MQSYGSTFAGVYNDQWKAFSENFAPVIFEYLGDIADKSLLDLCCGTGQFCSYFLDRGYRVTGFDLSKDMLKYAKANNRKYIDTEQFTAVNGNAKSFTLEKKYSVVTSLFDALNHLENEKELGSCFHSVYRALLDDGVFIFDLNTTQGLYSWNFNHVKEQEDHVLIQRGMFIEDTKKAYMEILGFRDTGGGKYERFKEVMFNTAFAMRDVENILKQAGFKTVLMHKPDNTFEIADDPEMEARIFFEARKN